MAVIITKCKSLAARLTIGKYNSLFKKEMPQALLCVLYHDIVITATKVLPDTEHIKITAGVKTSSYPSIEDNKIQNFFVNVLISYPDGTTDFLIFYIVY